MSDKERVALIAMLLTISCLLLIAAAVSYWIATVPSGAVQPLTAILLAFVCLCVLFGILEYFKR